MRSLRHRAYAYITKGRRLLLFTQPGAPEAGVQVPAGTIEAGEIPDDAVMRLDALPELSGNCGDKIELLRESMG